MPEPARGSRPGRLPMIALGLALRHPLRVSGAALGIVLTTACLWNVLMGQSARHPAPLFGAPPAAAEPQRRADSAAAPLPAARPDPATVASLPAEPPRPADPIGALIRGEPAAPRTDASRTDAARTDAPRTDAPRTDAARTDAAKGEASRIAAAQRALIKLGYGPLSSDGLVGPGTRSAIERFERDRKIPVTGMLAGRTAKLLGIGGA